MDAVLSRCVVPVCGVLASDEAVYARLASERVVFSANGLGLRLVPLPTLLADAADASRDIDAAALVAAARARSGEAYFVDFVKSLVSETCALSSRQRACETFGHPVACILAVSDTHPSPIGAFTQLYQQSFQNFPSYISPECLRCALYVRTSAEGGESFANISNEFGPHCYELRSDADWPRLAGELAEQSVRLYMDRLLRQWQHAHARPNTGGSLGFGKFLKKLVSSGPPRPEIDLFREVGREMQPHVASIPAARTGAPFDIDRQLRRLADVAFMLQNWPLARSAYDALRKPLAAEQKWGSLGACCEMAGLCASLQLQSGTNAQFVTAAVDQALYTYYSRVQLPVYSLRCVLLVCTSLCDAGHPLLAAGVLSTTLVELSPVPCEGGVPAETAVLMDRVAHAFNSHGWQRKTLLWNKLAAVEWRRAELA